MVELSAEQAQKYPHELSGGQARRVGIARALSLNPEFLVADEPTSGLDVSAAAGVLNLMKDLGRRLGLTYLIITHNLNVVGYIADRIAVMYLGQIVEVGTGRARLRRARASLHAWGCSRRSPSPIPTRRDRRKLLVPGEIPSPRNPPAGCRFHTRCPLATADLQDRDAAARADRGRARGRLPPLGASARRRAGARRRGTRERRMSTSPAGHPIPRGAPCPA